MPRFLLLLVLGCVGSPVFAQAGAEPGPEPAPAPGPAMREIIDAGNDLFQRAVAERDPRRLADLYTEDGCLFPPGVEPVVGREAIAAFWAARMKETGQVRIETLGLESQGDLAVEEGVVHAMAPDGRDNRSRYLVVWKRVGRRWSRHRDIWNDAAPAATSETAAPVAEPPGAATPHGEGTPALPPGAGPSGPAGEGEREVVH
jgi:uncharacterized protein (TIGR02246 family)